MNAFLEKELCASPSPAAIPTGANLPAPLNPRNWENACALPFTEVRLEGPWTVRNWPKLAWIDRVLYTAAVGARLSFTFEGRGLLLGFDFGKASAEFRYKLDEEPWKPSNLDRPEWSGPDGWYRTLLIGDDLPGGAHTFELEVVHGNPQGDFNRGPLYSGTNMNLALIGVIP